ncbi:MAG: beta-propeller domain-containing protein [Spirochaetota bacterium]
MRMSRGGLVLPCLLLASLLLVSCGKTYGKTAPTGEPTYLLEKADGFYTPNGQGLGGTGYLGTLDSTLVATGSTASGSAPVEPDVYLRDEVAQRLYAANSHRGLVAFDIADPAKPSLLGRCAVPGQPKELYALDDRIALLADPDSGVAYFGYSAGASATKSVLSIVDKSSFSPGPASVSKSLELGGTILDSRLVGKSLIIATNDGYAYSPSLGSSDIGSFSASIRVVDLSQAIPAQVVHSIPGSCSAIHVGPEAVFVALRTGDFSSDASTIVRFDIGSDGALTESGNVKVAGSIADRFKLDYRSGWLRVVAYDVSDWSNRVTRVFSIDWRVPEEPVSKEKGALELAPRESLYASRFDGENAYVVTFLTVDPLFVISFADPAKPVKSGELKVPGYSTHLEPVTGPAGEKLLFAVGVEGFKTKVSIFDVSTPEIRSSLREVGSPILLGDASSLSPANWDWKRINRLPALGAFALPYFEYGNGRGEYRVALVGCSSSGPSLLCELPDSGDAERTIALASDLVYTYAADRLQSWRINGSTATKTAEVAIVEDVAWATELGSVGIKLVRSGSRLLVRSFAPADFGTVGHADEVELPATDATGSWLSYQFGRGGFAAFPGEGLLFLLAESWDSSGTAKATLRLVHVGADLSLTLDPSTSVVPVGSAYGPPPGRSGPRIIRAEGGRVWLFHGSLSVVDTGTMKTVFTVPCQDGVEAIPFADSVAMFSWTTGNLEGYGRMSVEVWDLAGVSPRQVLGPLSFPGLPLWRSAAGEWICAYQSASWFDETRLLSVSLDAKSARNLGELPVAAFIRDWQGLSTELALVTGPRTSYVYATAEVAVASLRSGTRTALGRSSSASTLHSVKVGPDSRPSLAVIGTLEGWSASLATSASGELPARLVLATATEALICADAGAGLALLRTAKLAGGGSSWASPGVSLGGGWFWSSASFAGIERIDAR